MGWDGEDRSGWFVLSEGEDGDESGARPTGRNHRFNGEDEGGGKGGIIVDDLAGFEGFHRAAILKSSGLTRWVRTFVRPRTT